MLEKARIHARSSPFTLSIDMPRARAKREPIGLDELAADMTARMERRERLDLPGPRAIWSQSEIGRRLEVHSTTVGKWEKDPARMLQRTGDETYIVFRGYGYSRSEIERLIRQYGFNWPTAFVEPAESIIEVVEVVQEGWTSGMKPLGHRQVSEASLGGFAPEDLRTRTVEHRTLATGAAQRECRLGTQLLLHTNLRPQDRDPVIVEQDGVQALVIWPLRSPEWAMPYSAATSGKPVLLKPEQLRVVRVAIGDTRIRRTVDGDA